MKLKDARSIIRKFKVLVESYVLNDKVIDLALNDLNFKDFEDGIQYYTAHLTLNNCRINGNIAETSAAIHIYNSRDESKEVQISNTIISNNKVLSSDFRSSIIYSNSNNLSINLKNCVLHHNEGGNTVGLINSDDLLIGRLNLEHCTLAYNEGPVRCTSTDLNIINSVLWSNHEEEILADTLHSVYVTYSLVGDGYPGTGNFVENPLFVHESLLIPTIDSPCLNAGIQDISSSNDLSGVPRPSPANSLPDIGAYEYNQNFLHILVQFYFDENENGIKDTTEANLPFGTIRVNDKLTYHNHRLSGIFILGKPGTYNIEYQSTDNPNWSATTAASFSFEIDDDNVSGLAEIGLAPNKIYSDIRPIIESDRFRCGEQVAFNLAIKNYGTRIEEGTVWLRIDERLESVVFNTEPDRMQGDHVFGWDYNDLYPEADLSIDFIVTAPLINAASQVGETYTFEPKIETQNRLAPYTYNVELRCSFDPNDKAVNPNREDNLALISAPLVYKIRFQNTGNDFARQVVIRDTLDSDLDLASFRIISTSHPEQLLVSFDEARAVTFDFQDIYLPDSLSNEIDSHGHITYSINPLENTTIETAVENTAYIYFDYNPSIVTNTTESIMVESFPVDAVIEETMRTVVIYPNPVSDLIYLSNEFEQINVIDSSGKLVSSSMNVQVLDVKGLNTGTYLLELIKEGKRTIEKVVVTK